MIQIIIQGVLAVIFAVAIAVFIKQLVLFTVIVSSHSMKPTLEPGDRLLIVRIHCRHHVKGQDIIAFYSKEYRRVMVKRVIGLPSDSAIIQNDDFVSINGEKLQEEYVHSSNSRCGAFNVPKHQFLLLGDHRKYSTDSRSWADPFIADKEILGRAVFRFYPLRRMRHFGHNKQKK